MMKYLYITSAPSNLGGIAMIGEMLEEDVHQSDGIVAYNGFGQRSYLGDYGFALRHMFRVDLVVINTTILRRALIRDFVFVFLAFLTKRKCHLCFHGGNLESSSTLFDKLLVECIKKMSSRYLYLGPSLIPAKDASGKAGTFINPIELNPYADSYSAAPKRKSFLYLGRLVPEKGVLQGIEILRRVAQSNPDLDITFTIAGTGPLAKDLADSQQENFSVRFIGPVFGNQKLKLIADSDFFILPTSLPEGMPMSILECAVANTVIISSDRGAICDYIDNAETGCIIGGREVEIAAWTHEINDLVRDDEKSFYLRKNAYSKFTTLTNAEVIKSFL